MINKLLIVLETFLIQKINEYYVKNEVITWRWPQVSMVLIQGYHIQQTPKSDPHLSLQTNQISPFSMGLKPTLILPDIYLSKQNFKGP